MPVDVQADILGHGRDRHVHHRRVERHQELTRREREQHHRGAGLFARTGTSALAVITTHHVRIPGRAEELANTKNSPAACWRCGWAARASCLSILRAARGRGVLLDPARHANQTYCLTGPGALGYDEVAS